MLVLLVSVIALIYGCCSHSDNAFLVSPQSDAVVTSREVIIDEFGRLPTVTFPSGATITGAEENTLQPGIKVTITEQSSFSHNTGYFSDAISTRTCLYKIIAFQEPSNSVENRVYVTTIEKPFTVTLPNNSETGLCYFGIKESETDPWRFHRVGEQNADSASLRTVTNIAPKYCTFNLYRLGTSFCLVVYNDNNGINLPETAVNSLVASSSISILVKDNKYIEDIPMKGILKGIKLDSINPSDLKARITYRNNRGDVAPIKVNGTDVIQNSKADKTVPGYSYHHSFIVDSISDSLLMSANGEYTFTLNLNGIDTDFFSSGFLLEFYNKVNSEKVLPYNYTEFFSFKNKEVINLTIQPNSGKIEDGSGLYDLRPTFILPIGKELNDRDKEKVESAITVSNIESDKISKDWNESSILIGFKEELEPDTTYTLSVADVTDIEGISLTGIEDVAFTTKKLINSFSIAYNLDGGILENGFSNPTSYDEASETITLNNPSKPGYDFLGWTGSNGDTPQLVVYVEQGSIGDKTYSANYTPIVYSINYQLEGGQTTSDNPLKYDITSSTITLNNPSKLGFSFTGWTGTDLEYSANWSLNSYMLTLNMGAGVATVDGEGLHEYNSTVTASCTILDGFLFDSWTGDMATDTFVMPANDLTMTANAKPVTYTIAYELDGGSLENGLTNPLNYDVTSATIIINNPSKLGFSFTGWTGTDLDAASTTLSLVQGSFGNREYTANWHLDTYNIICNLDGGSLVTPNPTTYDIASAAITLNNPTKDFYIFSGWSGTDLIGEANNPVVIPQGSFGNKEYTANYIPATFTIEYALDGGIADNPTFYDITSATFVLNNPIKDNFDFLGWEGTEIPSGTASLTLTIPQGSTGQRSYVASYTPRYTITYNLGGGTSDNPTSYNSYSENITLNNPTKLGNVNAGYYLFAGWTGTDIINATTTVTIPQGSEGNKEYTANWILMEFVHCQAGTFIMGSPSSPAELGRISDEKQHQVTLSQDFYMGVYEVTQEQYFAMVATNPSKYPDGPTRPVDQVSWFEANEFCDRLNASIASSSLPEGYYFSLPTEAQWEYACRAGTTSALNNGKELTATHSECLNLSEVAWYWVNWGEAHPQNHTVGGLIPNAWGLYDMHGNVWEWCLDWSSDYPNDAVIDPKGPDEPNSSGKRIRRGGSRADHASFHRSAKRSQSLPDQKTHNIGFRVAIVKD